MNILSDIDNYAKMQKSTAEKYIKKGADGKTYVGVLISTDYGFSWSVDRDINLAIDKRLIEWLLEHAVISKPNYDVIGWPVQDNSFNHQEFRDYAESLGYKNVDTCYGYIIHWVEEGKRIFIYAYDGAETLVDEDSLLIM